MRNLLIAVVLFLSLTTMAVAADAPALGTAKVGEKVALPAPQQSGGMSLNEALATRRSVRSFSPAKLTIAELSQLLWAAQGVTDANGHRTAPSAHGTYFLHLYVATGDGFFEYLAAEHKLAKVLAQDVRTELSAQPSVKQAPVVFVVTGDFARTIPSAGQQPDPRLVNLEAGHATQNLLLEATALGLSAVPVGGIDPAVIAKAASLPASTTPIYLVPVGHKK
jgi:SagB-type dehydrogenase family enzyme